jgi:NAD(P)-dependent dehydrogenase (short-subunit alcohol dehydrogenase family)
MSKAAVDQLVRVAGAELRAAGVDAVGIASFYPGFVDTKMQADVRAAAQAYAGTPFAADLQPFVGVASSKKLRPAAFVAERLVELTAMPAATLNGKIWRLADSGWTAED